jgi:geranylgeranyl pyrophosphate synthase
VDISNRILAKTNDYFSWEVERVYKKDRIFNAVQCLITLHHLSEEQAKDRLKTSILQDERTYKTMLDEFYKKNPNLPNHLRRYVAAGPLLVGGNHYWSAVCPRYSPLKEGNQAPEATIEKKFGRENMGSNDEEIVNQCMLNSLSDRTPKLQALDETIVLDNSALLAPVHYIQSLPSKNYRSKIINAFNIWFRLSEDQLNTIKGVINDLHNASLILDDIQDESTLRRGSSTAHCIFGAAKCINSATYMVVQAASRIYKHYPENPQSFGALLDGLTNLSRGQSWDLDWKLNTYCPSVTEYMSMVDGKTGAMFQMLVRMMHSMSSQTLPVSDFDRLTQLFGRWYQVRDDFQNLQDPEYTEQKGFCEDLDEGKLSYPVILSCNSDPTARTIILGIFRQKGNGTPLARNIKIQILNLIRNTGALEETWQLLQQVEKEVEDAISALEVATGEPNPSLRLIAKLLSDVARP